MIVNAVDERVHTTVEYRSQVQNVLGLQILFKEDSRKDFKAKYEYMI